MINKEMKNVEQASLIGIITNPVVQFQRMKQAPFFWKPLFIVIAITILGLWVTSLGVELPSLDDLTDKEILEGRVFAYIGIVVVGFVTTIASVLISSVIFLLFTKIIQANVTFKQLFTMNTYIMLLTAVSMVINGIIIALVGNYTEADPLYTSLASFIQADGSMAVVLNSIELFSIWTLVLTAIGLHHVAGVSKRFGWGFAIFFFATGIISGIVGLKG